MFPKQAANSLVTETSQYFVFFCRYVCSAILAKCLIINVLRLILVILFFIAFLNITYSARHSWATIARNDIGADIDNVAKGLNHASALPITDIYIKPDWGRIDELNRRVIDFVLYERLNK